MGGGNAKVFVARLLPPENKVLEILSPVADLEIGDGREFSEDELAEKIREVDGILVSMQEPVTKRVIESGANLKIISKYGTGVDNIDLEAATKKGVVVANSPLNSGAVVEHTMLLILASLRKLPRLLKYAHTGGWGLTIPADLFGHELQQSTVGIIGLGRIGASVAQKLKCFGSKTIAYDPYVSKGLSNIELVPLDTLLRESDIVTLHVPLTDETRYLIDEKELKLMKPSAILVNTSRGAVVREDALVKALKEKWIAGAAVDVLERYPIPHDSPLVNMENLIVTPHMAASTTNARERVVAQAAKNIVLVLQGKLPPLEFVVNKEVLKKKK